LTLVSLAALAPRRAVAGSPITGTASCNLQGRVDFRPYLPLVQSPSGRSVRFKGKLPSVACDGAGVTGGRAPLASAIVTLRGVMPEGTDCSSLLDSVGIEKGVVNVKWRGLDAGRTVSLGVSQATVVGASFDSGSDSFVIMTAPIAKGAFAGSTLSIAIGLPYGDISEYTRICNLPPPNGTGFSSFNWDGMNDHVVTLTVQ
jgi:hypothetical protein